VGVCVCIRTPTPTPTLHTYRILGCELRGRDETPGGPKESRWTTSQHICIRIRIQSVHVYVHARRRDDILD